MITLKIERSSQKKIFFKNVNTKHKDPASRRKNPVRNIGEKEGEGLGRAKKGKYTHVIVCTTSCAAERRVPNASLGFYPSFAAAHSKLAPKKSGESAQSYAKAKNISVHAGTRAIYPACEFKSRLQRIVPRAIRKMCSGELGSLAGVPRYDRASCV